MNSRKYCWMAMLVGLMLTCHARTEEPAGAETRAFLDSVLSTEYCGHAIANGAGVITAVRGDSPVEGRGFVRLPESAWGSVLLSMAEEELDRCKRAIEEPVGKMREENRILAEGRKQDMPEEEQVRHAAARREAETRVREESERLGKMLSLMGEMQGEREAVLRTIERIALECPPETGLHWNANRAWIVQTMKTGNVETCLRLAKGYRARTGEPGEAEIDFALRFAEEALAERTPEEEYTLAVRYLLNVFDGHGTYEQCSRFDQIAALGLRGWVGSRERRRMAERFLDKPPYRHRFRDKRTGEERYEPTPACIAGMLRSRAAMELASEEKDLTDLREVYGKW